jgi:hypothetical protein
LQNVHHIENEIPDRKSRHQNRSDQRQQCCTLEGHARSMNAAFVVCKRRVPLGFDATLVLMTEESPGAQSQVDECVAALKSKIPPMEHDALDSRVEELLNDPSADADDVILILRQEFDPEHNPAE